MLNKHTVVAILEAKLGKEDELKSALVKVVNLSRAESACLDYRLHQVKDKPCQFILYENWQSKEDHQTQFNKPYILDLSEKIGDLLAKPYQVYFAEEIE